MAAARQGLQSCAYNASCPTHGHQETSSGTRGVQGQRPLLPGIWSEGNKGKTVEASSPESTEAERRGWLVLRTKQRAQEQAVWCPCPLCLGVGEGRPCHLCSPGGLQVFATDMVLPSPSPRDRLLNETQVWEHQAVGGGRLVWRGGKKGKA